MNKGGKIFAILILLLVVLFGIGQFFAYSNVNTPATQTNQTPPTTTPPTQVISYVPPQDSAATQVQNGSCFASSIAAPYRTDAWRCSVGNAISDPCFMISASSTAARATLLCGVDPTAANGISNSTFILRLTKPLPKANPLPPGGIPTNWAWAVQLIDGTYCTPFTGTRPFTANGTVGYYACNSPNPSEAMIFGDLDASSATWIAQVGSLAAVTSSLPTLQYSAKVPVSTVWQ